jgi:hypothetical protein
MYIGSIYIGRTYSFVEQKYPQLDEKLREKKGSLTHLFIVTNFLQPSNNAWIHEWDINLT